MSLSTNLELKTFSFSSSNMVLPHWDSTFTNYFVVWAILALYKSCIDTLQTTFSRNDLKNVNIPFQYFLKMDFLPIYNSWIPKISPSAAIIVLFHEGLYLNLSSTILLCGLYVTFHRKRSTFQNIWRQSSGTECTWTLTSNVLKSTPFPMERHIFLQNFCWRFNKCITLKFTNSDSLKISRLQNDFTEGLMPRLWKHDCHIFLILY